MLALHAVEQLEAQSAAHATPIGVALRTVVLVKRDVVLRGDEDIGKRKKVNVELEREVDGVIPWCFTPLPADNSKKVISLNACACTDAAGKDSKNIIAQINFSITMWFIVSDC